MLVHRRPAAAVIKIRAALAAQLNAPRDVRAAMARNFSVRPGCFERIGGNIAQCEVAIFQGLESPNNSGENVLKLPSTSTGDDSHGGGLMRGELVPLALPHHGADGRVKLSQADRPVAACIQVVKAPEKAGASRHASDCCSDECRCGPSISRQC